MILDMLRLQLVCLRKDIQSVVKLLQELGCVHVDDIRNLSEAALRAFAPDSETLKAQEDLRYLSARLQGLMDILEIHLSPAEEPARQDETLDLAPIQQALDELLPQAQAITEQRRALQSELDTLPRYVATLRKLLPIMPAAASLQQNICVGVLVSRAHAAALDLLRSRANEISAGEAEFVSGSVDEATQAMLIICPRRHALEIEKLLGQGELSRMRLPGGMEYLAPDEALARLLRRRNEIPAQIQALNARLVALGATWGKRCCMWQKCLLDELDRYEVLSRFGETACTVIIYGWVPARDLARLKEALHLALGDKLLLQTLPISHEMKAQVPVAVENIFPVKPFESLVNLLARPRYGGFDPSALMAFFMPVFFGMILGDIGYGLVILALSLVLMRRFRSGILRDLLNIIQIGAAWAVVFGVLYGELFGTLGEHWGLHPLWMERGGSENVLSLLLISVGIGAAHVLLGLVLGVWNAAVERSRSHLFERGGMLVGLISLFLLVGVLSKYLPRALMTPAVAGIIIGMVLLGIPSGKPGMLVGPLEMLSLVSNVLSYMRIAAIGLASVYLAKVANEMVGQVGSLVLGVLIAVLIHALNLVMGVFSPTIHSLRLHYVEFFRKFYEGGGKPYKPFQSRFLIKVSSSSKQGFLKVVFWR